MYRWHEEVKQIVPKFDRFLGTDWENNNERKGLIYAGQTDFIKNTFKIRPQKSPFSGITVFTIFT